MSEPCKCNNRSTGTENASHRPCGYMCNECGNCKSFCPYSSAPYQAKFTLFANEADFENSKNDGYVVLNRENMTVKVRLAGFVKDYNLKDADCTLYDGLKQVILTIDADYDYLYL